VAESIFLIEIKGKLHEWLKKQKRIGNHIVNKQCLCCFACREHVAENILQNLVVYEEKYKIESHRLIVEWH
jgi:hypothetical protein